MTNKFNNGKSSANHPNSNSNSNNNNNYNRYNNRNNNYNSNSNNNYNSNSNSPQRRVSNTSGKPGVSSRVGQVSSQSNIGGQVNVMINDTSCNIRHNIENNLIPQDFEQKCETLPIEGMSTMVLQLKMSITWHVYWVVRQVCVIGAIMIVVIIVEIAVAVTIMIHHVQ